MKIQTQTATKWMDSFLSSKKFVRRFVHCSNSVAVASGGGGAGVGNVKDQMIATREHLFKYTKRPKTASIIG